MCGYEGRHFGASYPDACCIDGYLWDLDSGDEDGLTSGGEVPCPLCNTATYLDSAAEEAEETSCGHFQFTPYCGAVVMEGAIRTAKGEAPEATEAWCRERGSIQTWDWPDRTAVYEGRARWDDVREVTIVPSALTDGASNG